MRFLGGLKNENLNFEYTINVISNKENEIFTNIFSYGRIGIFYICRI